MKEKSSVLIAICLLAAVVLFVALNNLYVKRSVAELSDILESLSDIPDASTDDGLDEFEQMLKDKLPWLSLSVNYDRIASIEGGTAEVIAYSGSRDTMQYRAALASLKEAVLGLGRNEKMSMENII
ncbi:MAG: DUF4363 family protein [Clostridia bacterium]|nr:DUF4363 family protein [Clostridia bacterium]